MQNTKCPIYCLRAARDSWAFGGAFQFQWPHGLFCVFPPFLLLHKITSKWKVSRATCIFSRPFLAQTNMVPSGLEVSKRQIQDPTSCRGSAICRPDLLSKLITSHHMINFSLNCGWEELLKCQSLHINHLLDNHRKPTGIVL